LCRSEYQIGKMGNYFWYKGMYNLFLNKKAMYSPTVVKENKVYTIFF